MSNEVMSTIAVGDREFAVELVWQQIIDVEHPKAEIKRLTEQSGMGGLAIHRQPGQMQVGLCAAELIGHTPAASALAEAQRNILLVEAIPPADGRLDPDMDRAAPTHYWLCMVVDGLIRPDTDQIVDESALLGRVNDCLASVGLDEAGAGGFRVCARGLHSLIPEAEEIGFSDLIADIDLKQLPKVRGASVRIGRKPLVILAVGAILFTGYLYFDDSAQQAMQAQQALFETQKQEEQRRAQEMVRRLDESIIAAVNESQAMAARKNAFFKTLAWLPFHAAGWEVTAIEMGRAPLMTVTWTNAGGTINGFRRLMGPTGRFTIAPDGKSAAQQVPLDVVEMAPPAALSEHEAVTVRLSETRTLHMDAASLFQSLGATWSIKEDTAAFLAARVPTGGVQASSSIAFRARRWSVSSPAGAGPERCAEILSALARHPNTDIEKLIIKKSGSFGLEWSVDGVMYADQ